MKSSVRAVLRRSCVIWIAAAIIMLQRLLRGNTALMRALSERVVRPYHRTMGVLTARLPFSVAEVLILAAAIFVLAAVVSAVVRLCRGQKVGCVLGRLVLLLLSFVLAVYAGFCLLWGVYYYGEDFLQKSGMEVREISVEELESVTEYFAVLTNRYAVQVPRNAEGRYCADRADLLRRSATLYREAEAQLPCLSGPEICVKPFFFSRLLSLTDFTGFFFPFTGEANVNTDFPPSLFPATVAHELAHQRGVAKEQEANFCAVYAGLLNGDPEYCYSVSLMAYSYLSNALYSADPGRWEPVSASLCTEVRRDLAENQAYWSRFETPVQTVSNTVYEGFLQSYDQELGLKSYGACVDLLVCHYLPQAKAQRDAAPETLPENPTE